MVLAGMSSMLTTCALPLAVCTTMLCSGDGHAKPVKTSIGDKLASDGTAVWLRFA
ncbi:hypothetical protein PF010_g9756 [Phytophthora fragariae]|uniref:RxLR effector protein n=1 Tax=Phytophthora fragariae TaxID=53985 RepID=A0A6G0LBH0_9STRA|nr:hypothetical protein PF010_g9756 [Phytophthora fragariae]KAE9234524.1 hypothetical protein PF004_g9358 [Phytophthora fragariae]KAE9338756.1 hypothetical protein PF008_g11910 [Phytophthora fragariae]